MALFFRLLFCIFFAGLTLYKTIDKSNELTELQISIPLLMQQLKEIEEKNLELRYIIEQFESPLHLIELARKPEFGHLKYPTFEEVTVISEVSPLYKDN